MPKSLYVGQCLALVDDNEDLHAICITSITDTRSGRKATFRTSDGGTDWGWISRDFRTGAECVWDMRNPDMPLCYSL